MLTVLVLEDDQTKRENIVRFLVSNGCSSADIHTEADVVGGIAAAKRRHYDIALIDLLVPMRPKQSPDRSGGVHFIRELRRHNDRPAPTYIVGITAFDDIADEQLSFFSEHLFGLVKYDASNDSWEKTLRNLIAHAQTALRSDEPPAADLAVICALEEPELRQLLCIDLGWVKETDSLDCTEYFKGSLRARGKDFRLVAATAPQMGMPASSAISMKVALKWRPRYLAMVGIAAATNRDINLGDVVLADPAWDYGSGKVSGRGRGRPLFQVEPWQIRVDPIVSTQFRAIGRDQTMLDSIRREWKGDLPTTVLRIHVGPLGSGSSVIASKSFVEGIRKQNRKVHAIDMETYGTMFAGSQCPIPAPTVFAIKGISDFADEKKNDKFRQYASYVSARTLIEWAKKFL